MTKLYKGQYILEVNPLLFDQNNSFIKEVLYHEFTHMYDSTKFLNYNIESFKQIMQIYSETHASEIETNVILSTQQKPYDLYKNIIWKQTTPLIAYMNVRLKILVNDFTPPSEIIDIHNYKFDFKTLYYFIGSLLSLKKHDINNYTYDFSELPSDFEKLFTIITNHILDEKFYNDYNNELLIQMQQTVEDVTQKFIYKHNGWG